jgi:cobalt/nickel transport system permease protein
LLAILLGPEAAFLVMASVLTVQALFFADGGLLALGANVFNLGFFAAFVAYPFVYRPIVGASPTRTRVFAGSMLGALVALQLGALAVVVETALSGVSELPFTAFLLVMQPIHLAIGIVEGLVTAAVVLFIMQAQPELITRRTLGKPLTGVDLRPVIAGLAIAALVAGGAAAWFASTNADGLEWSIGKVAGGAELEGRTSVHEASGRMQRTTALLPDYALRGAPDEGNASWPAVNAATSTSGVVGAAIVLAAAAGIGLILRRRSRNRTPQG